MRAIGLNFRDVLNVLGEYPGDPGPPGGDCSGWLGDANYTRKSVYGLAHAPLATLASAASSLIAPKPVALSFEEASTLPITWSTTHVAFRRAKLQAHRQLLVQAAAGGVGLKAVEYSQWLRARVIGTAGKAVKHRHLRCLGAISSAPRDMRIRSWPD